MAKPVNWNNVSMLTPGLKNLGNQFNAAFPDRDGTSDGAIGDYAHTQENSGHNPDDTSQHNAEWDGDSDNKSEVRAIDVDNNLNSAGVSMQNVIDHIRKLSNLKSVIRYMIYNRIEYHVDNNFNPQPYTGASAHTEHAHFSGARSDASDENTTFDFRLDELVALTTEDKAFISSFFAQSKQADKVSITSPVGQASLNQGIPNGLTGTKTYTWQAISDLGTALKGITTVLNTVLAKVDIDPADLQLIKDALAVPTAEQNANAVITQLSQADVDSLVEILQKGMTPDKLAELKAAL